MRKVSRNMGSRPAQKPPANTLSQGTGCASSSSTGSSVLMAAAVCSWPVCGEQRSGARGPSCQRGRVESRSMASIAVAGQKPEKSNTDLVDEFSPSLARRHFQLAALGSAPACCATLLLGARGQAAVGSRAATSTAGKLRSCGAGAAGWLTGRSCLRRDRVWPSSAVTGDLHIVLSQSDSCLQPDAAAGRPAADGSSCTAASGDCTGDGSVGQGARGGRWTQPSVAAGAGRARRRVL